MITVKKFDTLRMEKLIKEHKTMELGPFLLAARYIVGLKRREAADYLHLSQQSILNAEKGKSVPPRHKIDAYADLYGISKELLWEKAKKAIRKIKKEQCDRIIGEKGND